MKLLVTGLVILAVVYGVYNFTMAAYGWFQMASYVDEIGKQEATKLSGQQGSVFERGDRYVRIREGILKVAQEASVELRPENVDIKIVDNMLDVRLAWDAPMIRYKGKTYLDVPMTLQRGFPLKGQ